MEDNFTYLRFKQMIMTSYIHDLQVSIDNETFRKHLDLLRCRFDPSKFTHETIHEYRVTLFTQLQSELDQWNTDKLLKDMTT